VVAALVGVAVLALVLHPDGRYILRATWEEGRILLRRRAIADLAADPATSGPLRARLRLVLDARQYAESSLGLSAGENFTTFSRVDHDTLVLVLSAAYRDRLEPYRWWFPVVGRVPYRGYFDFDAARATRAGFERRGFDTYLRPASAFSTLGWFNDPLLSTTVRADTLDLVNTVMHELSHNTLFVKNHVEFNESFASFVGARGAAAFFRARGSDGAARRVEAEWEDEKRLSVFWAQLVADLRGAYARHPTDSAARVAARDSVYRGARRILVDSLSALVPTIPREWFTRVPLDNAALLARRVYAGDLQLFDQLFEREGRDVRRAVQAIRGAVRDRNDPFVAVKELAGGR
jgi:predicted aminopeptidase